MTGQGAMASNKPPQTRTGTLTKLQIPPWKCEKSRNEVKDNLLSQLDAIRKILENFPRIFVDLIPVDFTLTSDDL